MSEPLSYQLVAPLDWCQLKTLLWVVLPEPAGSTERWRHVSDRLGELVPASPPPTPDACRRAYERLAKRMPALRSISSDPDAGKRLWVSLLYRVAQRLFGGPRFMNLGYVPEGKPAVLCAEDEPDRLPIQLYQRVLADIPQCCDDVVVEVGCGGGGGSALVARCWSRASVLGLDGVADNIATARRSHASSRVHFAVADAERLPVASCHASTVISIESSEHYPSVSRFLSEVRRILRPGGYLVLADLRWVRDPFSERRSLGHLPYLIEAAGLDLVREADISAGVLDSIRLQDGQREAFLADAGLVEEDRMHFQEIMLCRGSRNRTDFEAGRLRYRIFTARRGSSPAAQA